MTMKKLALCLVAVLAVAGCKKNDGEGTTPSSSSSNGPRVTVENGHLVLSDAIHFETNSDVIKDDSTELLQAIAAVLGRQSAAGVLIEGHTDNTGSDSYNEDLSERRAQAVANWLRDNGVSQELEAVGRGSSDPVCEEDSDECRARNRRVDFTLR